MLLTRRGWPTPRGCDAFSSDSRLTAPPPLNRREATPRSDEEGLGEERREAEDQRQEEGGMKKERREGKGQRERE